MGNYAWEEPRTWIPVSPTSAENWRGATVFLSRDAGLTWERLGVQQNYTPAGTMNAALGTALPQLWDDVNSVTITMADQGFVPTSKSKLQVLSGRYVNRLLVQTTGGYELVGYADVSIGTEDHQITLSGFARGLHGTGDEVGNHYAGAPCWFIGKDSLFEIQWQLSEVAKTADGGATYEEIPYQLAVIPFGGQDPVQGDEGIVDYAPYRTSLKPRAPAHGKAWLRSGGDMELGWSYVSRAPHVELLGAEPARFLEKMAGPSDTYTFLVDIRDGSNDGRTVTVDVSRADMDANLCYDYTSTLQAADGATPPFTVTVSCISELYDADPPALIYTTPS